MTTINRGSEANRTASPPRRSRLRHRRGHATMSAWSLGGPHGCKRKTHAEKGHDLNPSGSKRRAPHRASRNRVRGYRRAALLRANHLHRENTRGRRRRRIRGKSGAARLLRRRRRQPARDRHRRIRRLPRRRNRGRRLRLRAHLRADQALCRIRRFGVHEAGDAFGRRRYRATRIPLLQHVRRDGGCRRGDGVRSGGVRHEPLLRLGLLRRGRPLARGLEQQAGRLHRHRGEPRASRPAGDRRTQRHQLRPSRLHLRRQRVHSDGS